MSYINLELFEKERIIERTINGNNLELSFTPGNFLLMDDTGELIAKIPIDIPILNALEIIKDNVKDNNILEGLLKFIFRQYGYKYKEMNIQVPIHNKELLNKYCSSILDLFIDDKTFEWLKDLFRASGILDKSIIGDTRPLLYKIGESNNHYGIDIADDIIYDFRNHLGFVEYAYKKDNTRGTLFGTYPLIPYLRRFIICYGDIFVDGNTPTYTSNPRNIIKQMKSDIMSSKFHGRSATISKLNSYINKKIPLFEFSGIYSDENSFTLKKDGDGRLTAMLSFEDRVIKLDNLNSTVGTVPVIEINVDVKDEEGNILINRGDIIDQKSALEIIEKYDNINFSLNDIEELKLIGDVYYNLISTSAGYSSSIIETLLTLYVNYEDNLGTSSTRLNGSVKLSKDAKNIYYTVYKDRDEKTGERIKLFLNNGIIFSVDISSNKNTLFNINNTRIDKKVLESLTYIDNLLRKLILR